MQAGARLRLRMILLVVAGVLSTTVIFAQEFWVKKQFNQWTNDELKKFMKDSPWAKNVTMATRAPGGNLDMGSGGGGGGGDDDGGGGGGGAGGGGARGGGGGGGGGNSMTLIVSWRSSLPMKQAAVRTRMGAPGEVPPDAAAFLAGSEEFYVVMIEGMPRNFGQRAVQDGARLKQSVLKVGKRQIPVSNIRTGPNGGSIDFILLFSKAEPIKVEENEVEVIAKLGAFDVKKKFKLKDMMVNGKLEL